MMMVPVTVKVLSLLSLFTFILHACAFQGENVEAARSNYKKCIVRESGVIRRKLMLNCFKESLGFETTTIKVQSGIRKLHGIKNTLNVKDEQDNVGNLVPEEKDMSGYFAFNADYKGPRHHPPKNN